MAIEAWRVTDGLFDPTVHDALVASGYDRTFDDIDATGTAPSPTPTAPVPGPAGIEVDERIGLVVLPPGCHVDLGGIGKGRAADLVIDQLLSTGAVGACVDLGGDVRVGGLTVGGGDDWVIAVDDPDEPGRDLALLRLAGGAVTTSSSVKRRWSTGSGARPPPHRPHHRSTGRERPGRGHRRGRHRRLGRGARQGGADRRRRAGPRPHRGGGDVRPPRRRRRHRHHRRPHRRLPRGGRRIMILAATLVLGASKVWWYVARSAGIVAWGLSALAVLWGLALATRALGRKPPAPWLLDVHRFLGALTVVFVVVHLVGLAFDPWASFGLDELLVPMASSWKPAAVAWGIVAFYLLLAIEGTSLIRSRLPVRVWRGVHLTSYAMYALATVHLLLSGTDRYNPVLRTVIVVSIGAVVFFTMYRLIGPGRAASVKSGGGAAGAPERRLVADSRGRPPAPTGCGAGAHS